MKGETLSRRGLLAAAGSLLAAPAALSPGQAVAQPAFGPDPDIDDELASEILYEECEPGKEPAERAVIKPFWFQKPEGVRPSAHWPADNVSFDFAHLVGEPNSEEPFELTAPVLQQLVGLNSFQLGAQLPKVLFGLRGCVLAGNADRTAFAAAHQVRAVRPNHIDLRCLIGVWVPADNTIALFKSSTVPNVDLMEKHIEGALGCNMMPAGLHNYKVGAHRAPRQPGAFRQQTPLWVMRSKKQLAYAANDPDTIWDDLDGNLPFDNIHAAMLSGRRTPPFFSSAGCQVIAGAYDANRVPTGAWAAFRHAAGLSHPPAFIGGSSATRDDGRSFEYALLTGKEAQLVARGNAKAARALRYGSSGPAVAQLQEKLGAAAAGAAPGRFDRKTLGAVIRWQAEKKMAPTGIVAAQAAAALGLDWS